jgi:hypothetical protein
MLALHFSKILATDDDNKGLNCFHPAFHGKHALAILMLSSPRGIQAQQEPTKRNQAVQTQDKQTIPPQTTALLETPPAIDIKVEAFRRQLVPGEEVGVVADVTNNSRAPVYLRQQDVQLVFALELAREGYAIDGSFPTEYREKEPVLSLKAGETYRVFWVTTPPFNFWGWLQFFRFAPGAYPISVVAKYWDKAEFDGDDYHTNVAEKTVEFAAPQSVIMFGAILGGLIFLGLSWSRAEQKDEEDKRPGDPQSIKTARRIGRIIGNLLGSVLMSVIVTILLSRIEQTQFFVKVSVSDFWGAIAVGFLANYGGFALLDKMFPGADKNRDNKQAPTAAPPIAKP